MIQLIAGLVIGLFVGVASTAEHGLSMDAKLIDPCELELPRSQKCHLIAVPVEEK